VLGVGDLSGVRVEGEVDEFAAAGLAMGAAVKITAEGYRDGWTGRVEEIPDAVTGRKLKPDDPGRPTDTRVLLVKIALDGPTPLKLGQRVEGMIAGDGGRGRPSAPRTPPPRRAPAAPPPPAAPRAAPRTSA